MITHPIQQIQANLKELYGPQSYYTTDYAGQELAYCGPVVEWITERGKMGRLGKTLDVGPGYGTLACYASSLGADVYTLDRNPYISLAVSLPYRLMVLTGDMERWQFPLLPFKKFNTVIITEVLEHFNFHPLRTLIRIRDLMEESGVLYLSTPDQESWGKLTTYYPDLESMPRFDPKVHDFLVPEWVDAHIWQYTRDEVLSLLWQAGLKVKKLGSSQSKGGRHIVVEAGKI